MKTDTIKHKIANFDLENFIIHQWNKISPLSKKTVLWVLLIANLVFLFHSVTFFWGDHDWNRIVRGVYPVPTSGRFFADWPLMIFGGEILPILNNVFSFLGFALAMLYLAKYWDIPKTILSYIVFALFVILMPYTLTWMWYIWQTADFWLLFLIFYALNRVQSDKWQNHILLCVSIFVSIAVFQTIFSTVIIAFLGRCLLDLIFENVTFRKLIKKHYKVAIDIFAVGLIYFGIFLFLKYLGKIGHSVEDYHAHLIAVTDLKEQILKTLSAIRDEFWLASAYIPTLLKRILLISAILSLFFCFYRKSWKTVFWGVMIICGILLSSQITPFLVKKNLFRYMRINFYAFPYIYALACIILLKQKTIFRSCALGIMIFSICYSTLEDIRCQKVWYLSKQAELNIYQEIIARIHMLPDFDPSKKYKLVSIGNIYTQKYFDRYNRDILRKDEFNRPFIHKRHPQTFLNFMERKRYITSFVQDYLSKGQILSLDRDYILNKAKPWPSKESVTIIDHTIYLIMDPAKLKQLQNRLNHKNNHFD